MDVFMVEYLGKPLWIWLSFFSLILTLLAFDLGVLSKKRSNPELSVGQSLGLSAFYIAIALLYGVFIWFSVGSDSAIKYYTGFAIEKSLSLDNIFVISLIFAYFGIPRALQHRVLFWGILGVIVLRAIMIGFGTAIVSQFEWILYFFAAFLIFTGIKMLFSKESEEAGNFANNPILKWTRRRLRVTDELHGNAFFVKLQDASGKMLPYATPLFLALILVETADLIFAVDSIPAIFAITTDPFIVYTSNIFAILGLRALYFALSALLHRFVYLKYALSLVLVFIGAKIFYNHFFEKLNPAISLGITLGLLAGGIVLSLWKTRPSGTQNQSG